VVSFCLVLALIVLVRWEVVDSPPFFDFAIGIWREAEYLARTGFDYYSLRYECEPGVSDIGGPRCYMVSIVPTLLGLAYRLCPAHSVPIVVYHLAVFASAAWMFVSLVDLLKPRLGGVPSLMAASALITTPILCVQIDMVGFEIFLAAAAVSWMRSNAQETWGWSLLVSGLAFSIKATGSLLTAALAAYLFGLVTIELLLQRRWRGRELFWGVAASILLGIEQGILWWSGAIEQQQGGRLPLTMAWIWFPDVILLLLLTVMAWFWLIAAGRGSGDPYQQVKRVLESIANSWRDRPEIWSGAIVLVVLTGAISTVRFIPRYAAFGVPFLYVLLPNGLAHSLSRRATIGLFGVITLLNVLNWNGQLFPDSKKGLERIAKLPGSLLEREGSIRERSHEYLPNHRANLEATRAAAQHAGGRPIVTVLPYSAYLAYPELGVVNERANVYAFFPVGPEKISLVKSLDDFEKDRPAEYLVLRDVITFNFALAKAEVLPPTDDDEVLFTHRSARPDELSVYLHRDLLREDRRPSVWLHRAKGLPLMSAARFWSAYQFSGGGGLLALVEQEKEKGGWEPEFSLIEAAALARIGQWQSLIGQLLLAEGRTGVMGYRSDTTSSKSSRGVLLESLDQLVLNDRDAARRLMLESCFEDAPFLRGLKSQYRLGLDLLDEGDNRAAGTIFRELLKSLPVFWPAEVGLARLEIAESRTDEARRRLEVIVRQFPYAQEPLLLFVELLSADAGKRSEARALLKAYLDRYPDSPAVARMLSDWGK
jgi:tetratricopeptide (TPR) repeat protein